ncbi:carbohydrate ABC transporter permease [Paenarthrobacter aromaticivorans]|uniref:carbohydrate ABC transporter permease n=1 Tax=Paenarthrobacter aromaticivorans TaxID=2849150 RepID=UPI003A80B7D2
MSSLTQQGGRPAQVPPKSNRFGWRTLLAAKGAAFTLPFAAGFVIMFILPLAYAVVQSLYSVKSSGLGLSGNTTVFVGLDNFIAAASDPRFWASMARVAGFACVQVPIKLALSLMLALGLDYLKGRMVAGFRIGLLVPYMIPGVVGTLVWIYLYSPEIGPLTEFGKFFSLNWNFLSDAMMWPSIGNLLTWDSIGFNMLIIYASLQSINPELFEAARLDGAGEARIAFSIKVPFVRSALVLTGMLSIIGLLQIFAEPLLFRSFVPEVVTKDYTPTLMIFNQAFDSNNYNYAAALSLIFAVVIAGASSLYYKLTNKPEA